MNMFWGQVEAHHCTTYATREYTALLKNLPVDYPYRVEACKETSLEIHGASYLPKDCEDKAGTASSHTIKFMLTTYVGSGNHDWTLGSRW